MRRLASYLLQQPAFSKSEKLVAMLVKKLIAVAALEKQAAAIEDLSGIKESLHCLMISGTCMAVKILSWKLLHQQHQTPMQENGLHKGMLIILLAHPSVCRAHAGNNQDCPGGACAAQHGCRG